MLEDLQPNWLESDEDFENTFQQLFGRAMTDSERKLFAVSRPQCPYCVEGAAFKDLTEREGGCFVCNRCGHSVKRNDPVFRCLCRKCVELNSASKAR